MSYNPFIEVLVRKAAGLYLDLFDRDAVSPKAGERADAIDGARKASIDAIEVKLDAIADEVDVQIAVQFWEAVAQEYALMVEDRRIKARNRLAMRAYRAQLRELERERVAALI